MCRQELHEAIREHSMEAGRLVKQQGQENDLLNRIRNDARFSPVKHKAQCLSSVRTYLGLTGWWMWLRMNSWTKCWTHPSLWDVLPNR